MTSPYFEAGGITLWHGDALAVLAAMPAASVDAVITDPPYSSGGAFRADRAQATGKKYVQTNAIRQGVDFHGDNRDQRAYGYWCALWMAEALRVTRPGGVFCTFTDWPPQEDAEELIALVGAASTDEELRALWGRSAGLPKVHEAILARRELLGA